MDELLITLKQYRSSFDVEESIPLKEDIVKLKEKLELEMTNNTRDTDMEKYRVWNLISFLCFILKDLVKCKKYNEMVLQSDANNFIANSNKARFAVEEKNFREAEQICKKLKQLNKDNHITLRAKAEIAFTYSRIGMKNFDKAICLYREVVAECDTITPTLEVQRSSEILEDDMCDWAYGLALITQRMLNISTALHANALDVSHEKHVEVAELYVRIINSTGTSACIQRFRARSYVDLGLLRYRILKCKSLFQNKMEAVFPTDLENTDEYFYKALDICNDDAYVLERSGKYFRYEREINMSIELLEKAIQLKESSFGYHHLALSLRRKLDIHVGNLIDKKCEPFRKNRSVKGTGRKSDVRVRSSWIKHPQSPSYQPRSGKLSVKHESSSANFLKTHYIPNRNEQASYSTQRQISSSAKHREGKPNLTLHRQDCNTDFQRSKMFDAWRKSDESNSSDGTTSKSLVEMIKCPMKPKYISYTENEVDVDKIVEYFDKAIQLSPNTSAKYDKGLFYRQLRKSEDALDIFEQLIKNDGNYCSLVQLANSYEQAAFCIHDMLRLDVKKEKSRNTKMADTMKMYLKTALEISCNLVSKIPLLENCWKSAPTLKTFLSGEAATKEVKEDLLFLYRKMKNYKEAIDVLVELENLAENSEEKAERIQEKVQHFLCLKNYNDAVIALNVIACLPDGLKMVDMALYKQVHIEAGIDALRRNHAEIARQRIKNAFHDSNMEQSSSEEGGEIYDIFILSNLWDEDNGRKLSDIMNQTGLQTTLNTDSKHSGNLISIMRDAMKQSTRFVILFETADEEIKNQMQIFTDMMLEFVKKKGIGRVVLVMAETSANIPEIFWHVPYERIDMDLSAVDKDFFQNENIRDGVKSILLSLAKVA